MSPLIAMDLIAFAGLVIAWALMPARASKGALTAGQPSVPSLAADSSAA